MYYAWNHVPPKTRVLIPELRSNNRRFSLKTESNIRSAPLIVSSFKGIINVVVILRMLVVLAQRPWYSHIVLRCSIAAIRFYCTHRPQLVLVIAGHGSSPSSSVLVPALVLTDVSWCSASLVVRFCSWVVEKEEDEQWVGLLY
ncbi:hypothetical protein Droror1_Dr00012798 [Drosera rotundifolia]